MLTLQRYVFLVAIPMGLLCIAWVWLGRMFFGAGGWMVFLLTLLAPVLLVGLALTTALSYVQRRPYERGRLSPTQAVAHLIMWTAMIGYGGFLVDFGDAPDSEVSVLTQAVGRSDTTIAVSSHLALTCTAAAIASYVWLLILLIIGAKNRPKPPAAGQHGPFAAQPHPGRPAEPPPPWT